VRIRRHIRYTYFQEGYIIIKIKVKRKVDIKGKKIRVYRKA